MKRGSRSLAAMAFMLAIAACGSGSGTPVRVTIPQGATLRVAADSLARAGVVLYPRFFRVYASFRRGDRAIKAGTYMLLSLIHISEPTRLLSISYAVFCLK